METAWSAPVDLSGIGRAVTLELPSPGGPSRGCTMTISRGDVHQTWRVALGGATIRVANTGSAACKVHGKILRPGRIVEAIWSKRWRRWVVRNWPGKVSR